MANKFIVTLTHNGIKWPLRSTVWAYSMDRAQVFKTREDAASALLEAKKFMKSRLFKAAKIEEIQKDQVLPTMLVKT